MLRALRFLGWSSFGRYVAFDEQWFGVPWGNFVGWYLVAVSFGAASRSSRLRGSSMPEARIAIASVVAFVGGMGIMHLTYTSSTSPQPLLAVLVLGVLTWCVGRACATWTPTLPGAPTVDTAARLAVHGASVTMLVLGGFAVDEPALLVVALVVAAAELVLHHWTRVRTSTRPADRRGGVMTGTRHRRPSVLLAAVALALVGVAACRDASDGDDAEGALTVEAVGRAAGCDDVHETDDHKPYFEAAGECRVGGVVVRIDLAPGRSAEELESWFADRYSGPLRHPCPSGAAPITPIMAVGPGWTVFTSASGPADAVARALHGTVLDTTLGPPVSYPLADGLVCPDG